MEVVVIKCDDCEKIISFNELFPVSGKDGKRKELCQTCYERSIGIRER